MSYFLKNIIDPVDAGGCWKARGRRLAGSNGAFLHGFQLEIGGSLYTLNDGTILAGGDNPEVTDWLDCDFEYRFEYGDCGADPCPDEELYIFNVSNCCEQCTDQGITIDQFNCIVYISTYINGCNQTTGAAQRQWFFSSDGITFTPIPGATGTFHQTTQDGFYKVEIYNSINPCICTSNVIEVNCQPSCIGDITTSYNNCVFSLISAPCSNGTWQLLNVGANQIVNSGAWTGVQVNIGIPGNGTYRIILTCSNGCVYTSSDVIITDCDPPACGCTASIAQSGCVITLTTNDCGGWTPVWQFSANGVSGWTTAQIGGTTFTPNANGFFRVQMTDNIQGCPSFFTNIVNITCVPNCSCVPSLSAQNCVLTLVHNCSGYSFVWQILVGSNWINVQTGGTTFTGIDGATYRVFFTKSGCAPVVTNSVTVTCPPPCICQIDLEYDTFNCLLTTSFSNDCITAGYSYQLQYRPDPSFGWTVVQSGLVTNNGFTYSPTQNGLYKLVIFGGTGCQPTAGESNTISVGCFPACGCTANVTLDLSVGMVLFQDCPGYTWVWQTSSDLGVTWTNVAGFNNSVTLPFANLICSNRYRVVLSKANCPDVTTNEVPYICV
jgi:hypothetical protein